MDNPSSQSHIDKQEYTFGNYADIEVQYKEKLCKLNGPVVIVQQHQVVFYVPHLHLSMRVNFKDMLSVAKNSKNPSLFSIIMLTSGGQQEEEFYDQDDLDEQQIQSLTKQQQTIKAIQNKQKNLDTSVQNFQLQGSYTIKIQIYLKDSQQMRQKKLIFNKDSQDTKIEQLQKIIEINKNKELLIEKCIFLYERIIKKLNQLEDNNNLSNSNKGIHQLFGINMTNQQENFDEQQWIEQGDVMQEHPNSDI